MQGSGRQFRNLLKGSAAPFGRGWFSIGPLGTFRRWWCSSAHVQVGLSKIKELEYTS